MSNVRTYFDIVIVNAKIKTTESEERIEGLSNKVETRCPIHRNFFATDIEMKGSRTKV